MKKKIIYYIQYSVLFSGCTKILWLRVGKDFTTESEAIKYLNDCREEKTTLKINEFVTTRIIKETTEVVKENYTR